MASAYNSSIAGPSISRRRPQTTASPKARRRLHHFSSSRAPPKTQRASPSFGAPCSQTRMAPGVRGWFETARVGRHLPIACGSVRWATYARSPPFGASGLGGQGAEGGATPRRLGRRASLWYSASRRGGPERRTCVPGAPPPTDDRYARRSDVNLIARRGPAGRETVRARSCLPLTLKKEDSPA